MAGFHDNAGTADAHVDIGLSDLNGIRLGSSGKHRRGVSTAAAAAIARSGFFIVVPLWGSEAIPTKDRHNRSAGAGENPHAIGDIA